MTRFQRLWNLACFLVLLTPGLAHAECTGPVLWTPDGPTCGVMLGTRAYFPGARLSPDMLVYVDESEEPAWFDLCLPAGAGVVCQGVRP